VGRAEVARIDAPLCGAGVRVLPHAATRDHDVELVALDVASRVRDLHDHVLASDRSRAGIVGVVLPLTRELDVIALAAGRVGHGDVTVGHVVRDGAGGLVVAGVGVSLLVLLAAGARRRSAHGRDAVGGACSGVPVVGPGTVGFAAVPIAARPPLGTTVQVRQVRGAATRAGSAAGVRAAARVGGAAGARASPGAGAAARSIGGHELWTIVRAET